MILQRKIGPCLFNTAALGGEALAGFLCYMNLPQAPSPVAAKVRTAEGGGATSSDKIPLDTLPSRRISIK